MIDLPRQVTNIMSSPFVVVGTLFVLYLSFRIVFNLFFHPLRKFPGPRIAAIGSFYEFYFDAIRDGTYLWEVERMHKKYGPIVRVNANELHIHDPHFYQNIYAGSTRRVNKYPEAVDAYNTPGAGIGTIDHALHRTRRALLNPFFSKRTIVTLEPQIHERIDKLTARLEEASAQDEVVYFLSALAALAADLVTSYFYGYHMDYLSIPGFHFVFPIRQGAMGLVKIYHPARFLPVSPKIILKLPIPILRWILPGAANVLESRQKIEVDMARAVHDKSADKRSRSVMLSALNDPTVPESEKSVKRLVDEGEVVIFAGMETTAKAISVAIFHVYHDKSILLKARQELEPLALIPDNQLTMAQLEALPFLTGIVYEGLRLSYGVGIRMPRIDPDNVIYYQGHAIPPGTPVSISSILMHQDPSIFPNPAAFDPDRWSSPENLTKFLVSFTKGSRQCLGMNLSFVEMYLVLARTIRRFDLELFDTAVEDVGVYHVRLTNFPRKGNGEVKVKVVRRLEGN